MDDLHRSTVLWEHAMFEFLRGEIVKSCVEGRRVDLV